MYRIQRWLTCDVTALPELVFGQVTGPFQLQFTHNVFAQLSRAIKFISDFSVIYFGRNLQIKVFRRESAQ